MASNELTEFLGNLDDNKLIEFGKRDALTKALNVAPPPSWVKANKFANGSKYLPIGKIESLLDSIYQEWQVEIRQVSQLAQSICATVRLHYKDPISGEWRYHDGVGAVPLKTDKDFSAADLAHIKSDAVQTGAPAAVSYAIKNAAGHLGNLFGKSLNREGDGETITIYEASASRAQKEVEHKQLVLAQAIARESKCDLVEALGEVKQLTIGELDKQLEEVTKAEEVKDAD